MLPGSFTRKFRVALFALSCLFITGFLAGCGGSSKPVSVAVTSSASTVDATDTATLTATVTNDKGSDGVTWTISGGGALSNTTTTGATFTAPAASASSLSVTVTATSVADSTKTASVTITVPPAPSISTTTLPQAAVGTQFSTTLSVSGGVSPYTWTVSSGTLPSCLTLSAAGVLSGTPLASCAGTFNVTFKVTDSGSPTALTATEALTITIIGAPAIMLPAPSTLPAGVFNTAYNGSVAAISGGTGAITTTITSGALPAGLSLNQLNGTITGTPTAAGTFTFTIQAADAFGDSATQTYSITVTYPALTVGTTPLPAAVYNVNYGPVTLTATGGSGSSANLTWTWVAASGSSLPPGVNLSTAGVISGKPTATGTFTFVVTATDSVAKESGQATNSISVTYPTLSITTSSLPNGVLNAVYPTTTLAATGGSGSSANYSWTWAAASGSSLPAGLNLSTAGVITGTPTAGGAFSMIITVADSVSKTNATATLPITITYPTLTISTASLPNGVLNAVYAPVTLAATGGADNAANYSWSWAAASGSSLPAGLALSTAGVISGTPTAAGSFSVIITVADSVSKTNATATLPITITYPTLTITTSSLPNGILNTAYSPLTLAATGGSGNASNYSWSWVAASGSSLPPGMSLSTGGILSGTPTSGGAYSVTITVADSVSKTSAQTTLTFNVGFTTLVITTNSLPAGLYNTTYGPVTLAGTGGSGNSANYTWTWGPATGSSLPAGLSLSAAGVISGKPTATGSYSVVVTLADSVSKTNTTATLAITVSYPTLTVTTTALPNGLLNSAYSPFTLSATGGSGSSANYTWTWAAAQGSSLPAGLGISAAGVISGTPTAAGAFSVVITVADSVSKTNASATLPLTVAYPTLSIITTTLPSGTLNSTYGPATVNATGGSGNTANYSWTWAAASGSSLPAGLSLSTAGVITGKPTAGGSFSVLITVADSVSKTNATATLPITINYPTLNINPTTLPNGVVNSVYAPFTLTATGGSENSANYSWSWTASSGSSLPPGLSFSTAGVISGTPTAGGNFGVVIMVSDSVSKSSATVSLSINITYPTLSVTTSSLPNGLLNSAYTPLTLTATGGSGVSTNYSWSWAASAGSSLPGGMSVSNIGVLSGTPTTGGNFSVVITVADSVSKTNASATLSLNIIYPTLSITTTSLPSGVVNVNYGPVMLAATGGSDNNANYSWSWAAAAGSSIPAGLSISTAGVISGQPTASGPFSVVITVADSVSKTNANATLSITINASLSITTTTLPNATTGAAYSQQLAASGGTGGNAWSTTGSSNLSTFNLSLSAAGLITGTPSTTGTASFTAEVKDSNNDVATQPLTIAVYGPLSLPAPDPSSLPGTGTTGLAYSGSISGSGGSGNYCYTVTGLPSDNLSSPAPNAPCGYISNSLPVSGTPGSAQTVTFSVKLTDTTTNASVTQTGYSIVVSNPAPLTLPTPNPGSLPSATVNQNYSGQINSAGGVGPTYTWTVNSVVIPTNGTSVTESDGLSVSSTGGPTLFVTGTPTSTGSVPLSVSVSDSDSHTAGPDAYSVAVNNAGAEVTGTILLNLCNSGNQPGMTVSINTTPVQTTTTDSNGNFSFATVPNGTYTITPSTNAPSSIFFPATQTVTVTGSPVSTSFNANLGYTVSGNVTFAPTTPTGQVYVAMSNNNCGGGGTQGTSITEATLTSGGAFTIRGVSPGSYFVNAFMDTLGNGNPNAVDPSGVSTNLTVSGSNLTGVAVTLTNPGTVTLTSAPSISGVSPFNTGALVQFNAIKTNGVEAATSYTLQWSTSSTFASVTGSQTFEAEGTHSNVWFVNGLTDGTVLYFRAYGTSAGTAISPYSSIVGPFTIGAPTGGVTVSGTVTFTGAATGPLYTGFYNQNTNAFYGEYIPNPVSPQAYSVQVPTGSGYLFVGVIDQNKDGIVDAGDIQNVNNNNNATTSITGSTSTEDLTLSNAGSIATVSTQVSENTGPGGTSDSYNLSFAVDAGNKLPVAVVLQPSSNGDGANVVAPMDIASCAVNADTGSGCGQGFQINANLGNLAPTSGDTYSFLVTYSDGTSGTVTATVTNVLTAFATNLSPTGTGVSVTPTFSWTDPADASNYVYNFSLSDQFGNQIWQIPGNNSNSNGFSSAYTSLTWGTDPTGGGSMPTVTSLNGLATYYWQIQVQDAYGNQSTASANFTTVEVPVSLPAASSNPLGSAVVSTPFSGTIYASGGSGNYAFTVNGTVVPTNGSAVTISNGDGLSASNYGGSGLVISGKPTSAETVSLAVVVEDTSNTSDTASVTYSLVVNATSGVNNSLLHGNYAFYGGGWIDGTTQANTQREAIIGSFVADGNGNITSGEVDINTEGSGYITNTFTGTYNIAANNTGIETLNITGKSGTLTIAFSVGTIGAITSGVASAGSFIEYDDTTGIGTAGGTRISGEFAQQKTGAFLQSKLDGNYIFAVAGSTCSALDPSCSTTATAYGPLSIAGVASFNGAGGITSGEEDVAVGIKQYSAVTLSGTYGTPDSLGRVTGTLTTTGIDSNELTLWPTDYVFYILQAGHFFVMSTNPHTQYAGMVGQFVEQQVATFTSSDFNGNLVTWESAPDGNYVNNFGTSNETSTSESTIAVVSVVSGEASISQYKNSNGTYSTNTNSNAGTVSVASNGRVTINISGGGAPVFYLYGPNAGFATETTGSGDHPGLLYFAPQSAGPFSTSTLSGPYVVSEPLIVMETGAESSILTATGGNIAIVGYKSSAGGSLTVENGTDTISVNSTTGLITTPDGATGVIISPTEWIIMDTTSSVPVIKYLQQ
ncbi:MAG: putative Ig domain-containing protein [Terracidiphilus sp.]|jgi:hypothetical protein